MDKSLDEIIGESKSAAPNSDHSNRGGVGKRRSRRSGSGRGGSVAKPKTVVIQNLKDNISEDDLRDLFRQAGPVVRVEIQRDSSGNRTGVAWVVYDFAPDAVVAAQRYNNRMAAGKVIKVKVVPRVGVIQSSTVSLGDRIGPESGKAKKRSQRRRESGKNRDESKKAANSNRARSANDLDAELDAYMQVDSVLPEPSAPQTSEPPEASLDGQIEV